jgi:minor extracellular serine protease Vpr
VRYWAGIVIIFASSLSVFGAGRPDRWAVILEEPPLLRQVSSRAALRQAEANAPRRRIERAQAAVRSAIQQSGVRVTGSTNTLIDALYVSASAEQAAALRSIPGVGGVVKMRAIKRHLNKALDLVNVPAAWSALGGQQNAGAGTKIGILDTGIDQTHPAFNGAGLSAPSGFPKCSGQDCDYTNAKVIVARSYVRTLAVFDGTPEGSRPDDLSPRDRVGHGTAMAMIAAGATVTGPAATITGVAPRAWLGNYKIFGSPGVNDVTFADVVTQALEDAFQDGMDVVTLSLGLPALWPATSQGAVCGNTAGTPCDPFASAVEAAASGGLVIVASAGNDGDLGSTPNLNSIDSPGDAPSVITVGATTNAHTFFQTARIAGGSSLDPIYMRLTDGPPISQPLQAPVVDVSTLGGDGTACAALPSGSLAGSIALVLRTANCTSTTVIGNAQNAGAVAVVIYRDQGNMPYRATGFTQTGIPSAVIGLNTGTALKSYIASHAGAQLILDPSFTEYTGSDFVVPDQIAYFSSEGPSIDLLIKPEIVAPGTGLYVATQNYDPNGDMYDATRFTVQQGTSFAAALVAGSVALAKQHLPNATAAQLKSAVVNTADPSNIVDFDTNLNPVPARVTGMGAGKLNAGNAVKTTITASPATISFGGVSGGALPSITMTVANLGSAAASLALTVNQRDADSRAQVSISPATLQLGPGQSAPVTVKLTGSNPQAGSYEGAISIKGGPVDIRVPYLYLSGSGTAANVSQLQGFDWISTPGSKVEFDFKVLDRYGVPVQNFAHQWAPSAWIDTQQGASKTTDALGIGYAVIDVPSQTGDQTVQATVGNFGTLKFPGHVFPTPTLQASGIVNAASGQQGQGIAPGSYISIFGSGLSPAFRVFGSPYLPVSLAGVSVSFDAQQSGISVPGHIQFVSDGQVNVQVPWELQGLNTVKVKVSIGNAQTAVVDLPLAPYSPALFEYTDAGNRLAAALDENNHVVGSGNPVQRGHVLQLYVNGLGPVDNQPASGGIATGQPLSTTRVQPSVTIGGQPATVSFSGLAPFTVGLYQVNVTVPQSAGTGMQPVVITAGTVTSKPSNVFVQ